jgi:hypothetical protein
MFPYILRDDVTGAGVQRGRDASKLTRIALKILLLDAVFLFDYFVLIYLKYAKGKSPHPLYTASPWF